MITAQHIYKSFGNLQVLKGVDLTIEAGFYEEAMNFEDKVIKHAKSINFSNMDEIEFSELYNRTIDVIVKYFNFKKKDILEHIEQYF